MNKNSMNGLLLVGMILVSGLVLMVPEVSAAAPSFDCEIDFKPSGNYTNFNIGDRANQQLAVNNTGQAAITIDKTRTNAQDSLTAGITTSCSNNWTQDNICSLAGGGTCGIVKVPISSDPGGNFAYINRVTRNGTALSHQFQHFNASTGSAIASQELLNTWGTCANTTEYPLSSTGYYNADNGSIEYAFISSCGSSFSSSFVPGYGYFANINNYGLTQIISQQFPKSPDTGAVLNTVIPGNVSKNGYSTLQQGSSTSVIKFNITSGNTIGIVSPSACGQGSPGIGNVTTNSIFVLSCSGTNSYGFSRINDSAWAVAQSDVKFGAGGNNNLPGSASLTAYAFGGDDNMLACGESSGDVKIFKLNTTTDANHTIEWNITANPENTTAIGSCNGVAFDHVSGFYIWGQYNLASCGGCVNVWVKHFTGGGFVQPQVDFHQDTSNPTACQAATAPFSGVDIVTPASPVTIPSPATIAICAKPYSGFNSGSNYIEFFLEKDGIHYGNQGTQGCNVVFNGTGYTNGTYTCSITKLETGTYNVSVSAFTSGNTYNRSLVGGLTITSPSGNVPPVIDNVTLSPSPPLALGAAVQMTVNAHDVDGSVVKITAYYPPTNLVAFEDTSSPYQFNDSLCYDAIYKFVATDNQGGISADFNYYLAHDNTTTVNETQCPISGANGANNGIPTGTLTIPAGGSGGGYVSTPTTFFGFNISYLATQFGIAVTAVQWLLGILVVALVIYGLGASNPIISAVAILLGVGLATLFGLFPVWLILVLVFLLVAVVAKMFFGGSGDEM